MKVADTKQTIVDMKYKRTEKSCFKHVQTIMAKIWKLSVIKKYNFELQINLPLQKRLVNRFRCTVLFHWLTIKCAMILDTTRNFKIIFVAYLLNCFSISRDVLLIKADHPQVAAYYLLNYERLVFCHYSYNSIHRQASVSTKISDYVIYCKFV